MVRLRPTQKLLRPVGRWSVILLSATALGVMPSIARVTAATSRFVPVTARTVEVVAHRGASSLYPQNTLPAVAAAIREGVSEIEFDIQITADGVAVAAHDATISGAMCSGPYVGWKVSALTLAQVQTLDCGGATSGAPARPGTPVPTLAEVLTFVKYHSTTVRLQVELKRRDDDPWSVASWSALVGREINLTGMAPRVTLMSFDWSLLRALAPLVPQARRLGLLTSEEDLAAEGDAVATATRDGLYGLSVNHGDQHLRADLICAAHIAGLKVYAWTVNDPARQKTIIDRGVDGLVTDDVRAGRWALSAAGIPLPTAHAAPEPARATVPVWSTRTIVSAPTRVTRKPNQAAHLTMQVRVVRTDGKGVASAVVIVSTTDTKRNTDTFRAWTNASGVASVKLRLRSTSLTTVTVGDTSLKPSGVATAPPAASRYITVVDTA